MGVRKSDEHTLEKIRTLSLRDIIRSLLIGRQEYRRPVLRIYEASEVIPEPEDEWVVFRDSGMMYGRTGERGNGGHRHTPLMSYCYKVVVEG